LQHEAGNKCCLFALLSPLLALTPACCLPQIDDSWRTILWPKPAYLQTIGLQPFYAQYQQGGVAVPVRS